MANAEDRSDSEERNEEGSRSGFRVNLRERIRELSWLSNLERSFGDTINFHVTGRHVVGVQQVFIRTFPPTCLVL